LWPQILEEEAAEFLTRVQNCLNNLTLIKINVTNSQHVGLTVMRELELRPRAATLVSAPVMTVAVGVCDRVNTHSNSESFGLCLNNYFVS
jgi:hypothetical protein